jgi:hypothetical protein
MTTTRPTRIGKTTVAACARSSFAQVRHDDPVVAIDADTAFGRFGCPGRPARNRVVLGPSRVADEHLDTFAGHREPIVPPIPGSHLKGRDVRQRRRTGHPGSQGWFNTGRYS